MRIRIKVDSIEPHTDTLVEEGLKNCNLPKCFGAMVPPILPLVVAFEDTEILTQNAMAPKEDIVVENAINIMEDRSPQYQGFVLTKANVEVISKYKREKAQAHVDQLHLCFNCSLQDLCYKLTQNYLKFIQIEEHQ